MLPTAPTIYYSQNYNRTAAAEMTGCVPAQPTADTSRAERRARVLPVLDESRAAVRSALLTLALCEAAPIWPDAFLATPTQAYALRALVALTRDHTAPGTQCPCADEDRNSAHNLAKEWLHLWRLGVRHVQNPDTYGWDLVTRAALVLHDCAAFASTGDPADILGPAATPPDLPEDADTPQPSRCAPALDQRTTPERDRHTQAQPVRVAGQPADANRSPWFT